MEASGPVFVRQPRNLTPEGQTKPGHVPDLRDAGPGRIVALVPAHNEQARISETLESIAAQTRPPDEVIVIADNCTDRTAAISLEHGAKVHETAGNDQAKAGALNQALDSLLPQLGDEDKLLIMDADSSLVPAFLAHAARRLHQQEPELAPIGGVGGIFFAYPLHGLVRHLQNNEYVRYAREVQRRRGRADVLTGTATLYPARVLRDVRRARRAGSLPRGHEVYDVEALTEDNELTIALKRLGRRCVSPRECTLGTAVMPTWSRLYYQRLRWQRGALENLMAYGICRATLPYLFRQTLTYLSVAFVPFFLTVLLYTTFTVGFPGWPWFWLAMTGIAAFERVWAAKRGGWKSLGLAGLLLPEILFDQFLNVIYVKALTDVVTRTTATWERRGPPRAREIAVPTALSAVLLAGVVAFAVACVRWGIAWQLVGLFVLSGCTMAAVRLSRLYPSGLFLASGELPGATKAG